MELILASQSPRRHELLKTAGYEFTVFPIKVSESIDENLTPEVQVVTLAQRKAEACLDQHKHLKSKDIIVLSADTMVVFGGKCLNKPKDISQAAEFLRRLSGKTHHVMTGFCLMAPAQGRVCVDHEVSEVHFREISELEIQQYILTGEPMDKAGAYGIQGEGKKFVSELKGSWSNVVGLPMERLEQVFRKQGWHVGRKKS